MATIILNSIISTKLGNLCALILAFFSPIQILFHLVFVVVLLDTITAIFKYYKQNKTTGLINYIKGVKSHGLKKTIVKLFLYELFVGATYLFEIAIFGKSLFLANIAAGLISLTELHSCAENSDIATGSSTFITIFKKVKDIFVSKIDKQISSDGK